MVKEQRKHKEKPIEREDETDAATPVALAQRQTAQERKAATRARRALQEHVGKATQAALLGANLFQAMVRGDGEEAYNRKLHPEIADRIGEKVIDKACERLKEALVSVSQFGEELAAKSTTVFSAVKAMLTDKVKTQQDLTVLQVADKVMSAVVEASTIAQEHLNATVAALPEKQLAAMAKILWDLRETANNSADAAADSPENGKLADGVEAWGMEKLFGLPSTGGVAAREIALQAYSVFQEGVRDCAMSAHEREDAIQHRLANPHEDNDKFEAAKNEMGPHTKAGMDRDERLDRRVNMTLDGNVSSAASAPASNT